MPYNDILTRTDAGALMPEDAAREIFQSATEQSFVLQVARRLPDMPRQARRLPVVSALPTAYFVGNKGDGGPAAAGLKQTSDMAWDNVYLYAEELAVMKNKDGADVAPVAVRTRKNVRIVKLEFTGTASVLTP